MSEDWFDIELRRAFRYPTVPGLEEKALGQGIEALNQLLNVAERRQFREPFDKELDLAIELAAYAYPILREIKGRS